ncbi:uncharacterized protein Z520_01342 [Fonsecaea multimorphosa CBS 102226]|uniref:DUF7580 domain-containing protein n=1 Tax=Fonsecaea multimorphosa CBS 102226 TaxID=1442371 RepID=A0A0D2J0K8_9EURO|nr:uncharacterized protein Z520_01342 [Fonsecaea multimorphosa CBS 102226]KIY02877.1 hypothetical protein Z520_01342 [Fonsecaea multimorphosa CBS 102226]OAL30714.1 hypothetical protein AYO22_01334 [Fonsecaea multimorphosa]
MSGFEVVGLILGLYPLVVDAVDYCRRFRSGEVIHDLLEEVRAEKVIFCNWIQHLCISQLSGTDLQGILDNNSETFGLWKNDGFLTSLMASRDMESTRSIAATLIDIHAELQHIHQYLERIKPGRVDRMANLKAQILALGSGLDSSGLKRRVRKIHQLNERLRRVMDSSPERRYPQGPLPVPTLTSASCSTFATGVFRAVESHFRCSCQRSHPTKLQLPLIRQQEHQNAPARRAGLQLLFSVNDDASSVKYDSAQSISATISNVSLSGETSVSSLKSQPTENEHSQGDYPLSSVRSNNSLNSSVTLVFSPKCYSVSVIECEGGRGDEITDLCSSFRSLEQESDSLLKRPSLGYLRAPDDVSYELRSPKPITEGDSRCILSLEDLFSGDHTKLARRHRLGLALRLACGITQLLQTPWIRANWTWGDFSVMTDRQQGLIDDSLFVTKQFQSFGGPHQPSVPSGKTASQYLGIALPEPILARLGYALIELASGKRLASLQDSNGPTSSDRDLQDLLLARHLLDTGFVVDHECQAYSNVVHACLYQMVKGAGGFGAKKLKSQDPSFERDMTRAIVQPLYNLCSNSWGGPLVAVTAF